MYKLREACEKVDQQMRAIAITPKYVLPFLQNGRLVWIKDGRNDFGWGVIVGFNKNKDKNFLLREKKRLSQKRIVYLVKAAKTPYKRNKYIACSNPWSKNRLKAQIKCKRKK